VRDAGAVVVRPREPAGLIGGLRIVHAGVGESADIRESARFEVVEVERAPCAGLDALRAEADIGDCARPRKGDDISLSMKVRLCFWTSSIHNVNDPLVVKA